MPRTKLTRHQLKEQDEITTSLHRFTEIVVARKKEATIGLTILAVLVIAIFGWSFYRSRRNANAQAQLSQAITIYNDTANIKSDKERYEKSIAEAQKTYDQYRSLPAPRALDLTTQYRTWAHSMPPTTGRRSRGPTTILTIPIINQLLYSV